MQLGDVPSTSSDCSDLDSWIGFKPKTTVLEGLNNLLHGIEISIRFDEGDLDYADLRNYSFKIL